METKSYVAFCHEKGDMGKYISCWDRERCRIGWNENVERAMEMDMDTFKELEDIVLSINPKYKLLAWEVD